jgi:hypothetical protein
MARITRRRGLSQKPQKALKVIGEIRSHGSLGVVHRFHRLAQKVGLSEYNEIDVEDLTREGQHNSNHGFPNPWTGRPRHLSSAL